MNEDEIKELRALTESAARATKAYSVAAESAGSPIDRRLAASLDAFAGVVRKQSEIVDRAASDAADVVELRKSAEALASEVEGLRREVEGVEQTVRGLGRAVSLAAGVEAADAAVKATKDLSRPVLECVREVREHTDEISSAMCVAEGADAYKKAVDECCERISKATWLAVAAILTAACAGVVAAAMSAFWLTSLNPAIQRFIADNGLLAFVAILAAAAFVVYFIWCFATRKRY